MLKVSVVRAIGRLLAKCQDFLQEYNISFVCSIDNHRGALALACSL